jgi:hypothetical protein
MRVAEAAKAKEKGAVMKTENARMVCGNRA